MMKRAPLENLFSTFSMVLGIGVIVSLLWMYRGNPKARNIFQVLLSSLCILSLISILWNFQSNIDSFNRLLPSSRMALQFQMIGRVIQHILSPVICVWYLNRPSTKVFFSSSTTGDTSKTIPETDFFLQNKISYILFCGLFIVVIYRFLASIPFPAESVLPMIAQAPSALLLLFLSPLMRGDTSLLSIVILPFVSTLFWFLVGMIIAYFVKTIRRVILCYLGLEIFFMASTFFVAFSIFSRFPQY